LIGRIVLTSSTSIFGRNRGLSHPEEHTEKSRNGQKVTEMSNIGSRSEDYAQGLLLLFLPKNEDKTRLVMTVSNMKNRR